MTDLLTRFRGRLDLHQSPIYADLMRHIGWQVHGKSGSQLFYRSLGPFTIAKLQRPTTIDLDDLTHFRRSHHTLTTYLEGGLSTPLPTKRRGIRVEPFAHSCTSLIDLSGDSRKVLASFSQKTRYNITHSLKQNRLKITTTQLGKLSSSQLAEFYALHADWSKQKHVVGHPVSLLNAVFASFARHGDLHLAYAGNTLVGALLILYADHVATYYAALASDLGYRNYAPTLLTWSAIQVAKDKGCDIFDFGGIYDPRYPSLYKRWHGFTKFKSGFHPTVVSYPATTLQLFW